MHSLTFLNGQRISFDGNSVSITETIPILDEALNSNTPVLEAAEGDDNENVEGGEKLDYDYDEDYDQQATSTNQTKPKTGIIYTWAKWPKWNKCSRPCGGGVQTRIRNCIEK